MDQDQSGSERSKIIEITPTIITSPADLLKFHQNASEYMRGLCMNKNDDYTGGSGDPFYNFHDSGAYGIITRLGDKYKRLLGLERRLLMDPNFALSVPEESGLETALDAANYALLYAGYKRRRRK